MKLIKNIIEDRTNNTFIMDRDMKNKEKFNAIMKFAQKIIDEFNTNLKYKDYEEAEIPAKEHPLLDVIRLLGRSLQTEYLSNLMFSKEGSREPEINNRTVMFDTGKPLTKEGDYFSNIILEVNKEKSINLSKDLILPWPWDKQRLIESIAGIGEGRLKGSWRYDDNNHSVTLWLPLGIVWVNGGNHSITTGIIQGEGIIVPRAIYDITPIYKFVYCDGAYYRRTYDNEIISAVTNVEFGAIFEIGRIMAENNISY